MAESKLLVKKIVVSGADLEFCRVTASLRLSGLMNEFKEYAENHGWTLATKPLIEVQHMLFEHDLVEISIRAIATK